MRFPRRRYQIGALLGVTGAAVAVFAATAVADPAALDGQAEADALVAAAKSTGSVVVVDDNGTIEQYGSGTTTNGHDDVPDADDQFRVASNTKMYVSTVLLQLAEEGTLDLDAPIGEHLPGLVQGEGIDESTITVRDLLRHSSGLADNLTLDVIADPSLQWFPPTPEDMVGKGTRHGSQFEPGSDFLYSNTGYTVLGLLIEKLTGQRIGEAIDERIVQPLGLKETSYAYAGDKEMQGAHFRGYLGAPPALFEVSGHEPGIWAGAGALVSSGSDMTTFLNALLGGELLSDASLEAMKTPYEDNHYGLGLQEAELSCGKAWGHTGHVIGYVSFSFTDGNGKSVFAAVNTSPGIADPMEQFGKTMDAALCGTDATGEVTFSDVVATEFEQAEEQAEAVYGDRSTIYDKD